MIHARGLVQTFQTREGRTKGEVRAVDGVDLDVAEGEVVGFLGPNGAGKTTTLRMLTTLLRPTAGTATVAGYDVVKDSVQVRRRIGYVSQAGSTGTFARAGDEVVDHGMLYGMSRREATKRGQELFAQLDLEGLWTRQPKAMSGGQRRRLDIVMGLIHQPGRLLHDEPTTRVDERIDDSRDQGADQDPRERGEQPDVPVDDEGVAASARTGERQLDVDACHALDA